MTVRWVRHYWLVCLVVIWLSHLHPPSPGFLQAQSLTHVWWLAGRRVTLQTRYFLRMVPQCVTSTFKPGGAPKWLKLGICVRLYIFRTCEWGVGAKIHRITFDFFGEFDPVRVRERPRLLVYVVDIQHFTHELDHWLGFVKGGGRYYKIKGLSHFYK